MNDINSHTARARIEALLTKRGAMLTDVAVLQPAEPFLDTAGDELRRRIFMARGVDGSNVCLRPEFTIPVCLKHLQENGNDHARYAYVGEVFRQGRVEGMEFLQAGIEDLGDADHIAADVRAITDALGVLDALGNAGGCALTLGDQTVFDAVLRALALPSGWRVRLADAFGDADAMAGQLAALAAPKPMPDLPEDIASALEADAQDKLEAAIGVAMDAAGLPRTGGRTSREIAKRLLAKKADAAHAAAPERVAQLEAFLAIDVPLGDAMAALKGFADAASVNITDALDAFDARIHALAAQGHDLNTMRYAASFGRALDYYTGLVFEVRERDGTVLVGGGRYDRLLEMLGADTPIPGVGFSLWLDCIDGGGAS